MRPAIACSLAVVCLLSSAACSEGTASVNSEQDPSTRDPDGAVYGVDAGEDPSTPGDEDDGSPGETGDGDESDDVFCSDGVISAGDETCDDGNLEGDDGCGAGCQTEAGWSCPVGGSPCVPAACGDGIIAGFGAFGEECDDHNAAPLDGCSRECKIEPGYVCDAAGCHQVVCGDDKIEGDEGCEDGNDDPFDACSKCQVRPSCGVGPCAVVCGDGMIFPAEACDDGNKLDGDGCSAACQLERGFRCTAEGSALGDTLLVPVVFRDFTAHASAGYEALRHLDFHETVGSQGISYGMVGDTLDAVTGNPVYTGLCEKGVANATACKGYGADRWQTHSKALFDQWYGGGELASEQVSSLTLLRGINGRFSFDSVPLGGFFPLDGAGWVRAGMEAPDPGCTGGHNFGFTSEVRDWFTFRGGESLTFSGDDDVWVFIGGKLALDLGGVHGSTSATVALALDGRGSCSASTAGACVQPIRELGLVVGNVYEIALFHAERRGCDSNFRLDLAGFERTRTACQEVCGDGIVTPGEECDDGNTLDNDTCSNTCIINLTVE